jgi:hypothetical protein
MKGIVFTEFLEMVEARFSAQMVDDIIDDSALPSDGAYTAVGTYHHQEMVSLISSLSRRSGLSPPELMKQFGYHLFGRFVAGYPSFFGTTSDALQFLAGIEQIIHAEVRKLYPDAELPRFEVEHHDANTLSLRYDSHRHFEDLAEGLILGCITHFGGQIELTRETVGDGPTRQERFLLRRG